MKQPISDKARATAQTVRVVKQSNDQLLDIALIATRVMESWNSGDLSPMIMLELRDALLARLEEERPAGFILYDDAVTFAFDSLPSTEYGDELATIKERARLQVPIFKATEFATYLARNTVAGYEEKPVMLDDPYTLTFTYVSSTTTTSDISGLPQIEFNLSGTTRIIWIFDESKLQSDIVGLSKTALPSVLSGYPAIERAEAVVRPFWKQSFPESASEISVNITIGDE